jgi:hypothetical protein
MSDKQQLIQFPESSDELCEQLAATVQRRDAAAAAGRTVEAERLNSACVAIDDELALRAKVAGQVKAAELPELHKIYFGEKAPPKGAVGWTGRNGLE